MTEEKPALRIALCAHKALLYEALTAPKPGLVDRFDPGAHRDMDIFTFVDSAEALLPYFCRCAAAGIDHGRADETLFAQLREYGLAADRAMLAATGGVNTHKGAVLSLGLLCAAAGIAGSGAEAEEVCLIAGRLAAPLLEDFRRIDPENPSYGEAQYLKTGCTGIRGEAAAGFPSVRELGLPAFRGCREKGMSMNDSALFTLMRLIAGTEDTTLLKRCGDRTVETYRREAAAALEREDLKAELTRLNEKWSREGISAGGSADLLGVTLFLVFLGTR